MSRKIYEAVKTVAELKQQLLESKIDVTENKNITNAGSSVVPFSVANHILNSFRELSEVKEYGEIAFAKMQCCPKCEGQGIISKPPYIAGDVRQWNTSVTSFLCDVCNGAKIIPMQVVPDADSEMIEFAEWCSRNDWENCGVNKWQKRMPCNAPSRSYPEPTTTYQLLTLFRNEKKK